MSTPAERDATLEEKYLYALPDGDAGIVQKDQLIRIQSDRTTYNGGDEVTFTLASTGMALDPEQCFIHATVTLTGAANSEHTHWRMSAGSTGMLRSVETVGYTGTTLERIDNYNVIGALVDKVCLSDEDKKERLAGEGWDFVPDPKHLISSLDYACLGFTPGTAAVRDMTLQLSTTANNAQGPYRDGVRYGQSFINGRDLCFRLRHSGIWGGKRLIPLQHLGQVQLKLQLEPVWKTFQQMEWSTEGKDGDSKTFEATAGCFRRLTPLQAAVAADTSIDYTLTNVYMYCRAVKLSPAMEETMDEAVNSSGLPMHFDTWHISKETLPSNNLGKNTWEIGKSAANVRSILTAFNVRPGTKENNGATDRSADGYATADAKSTVSNEGEIRQDSFQFIKPGITNWRYRLGTEYRPNYQVDSDIVGKELAMRAIPQDKCLSKKRADVRLDRYTYQCLGYINGALVPRGIMGIGVGAHVAFEQKTNVMDYLTGYIGEAGHAEGNRVDTFFCGVNMETTEGVPLSGKSTNAGTRLIFECDQTNTSTTGDTHRMGADVERGLLHSAGSTWSYVDVFNCMRYTQLLLIQSNRNITVKE